MSRQLVRLLLIGIVLTSAFAGRSFIANVAERTNEHIVQEGETLSGIAVHYGIGVEQLRVLNDLENPDSLRAGQTLRLPPSAAETSARQPGASEGTTAARGASATGREYVVKPGDTLSGIAKALGVAVKALGDANTLADPNRLVVGQKLAVPAGAAPPSTDAATRPADGAAAASSLGDTASTLERLAQQYGVDPSLVKALAWIETDGRPRALDAPGGLGLLSVTAPTFEHVQQVLLKRSLDRENAEDNAEAGVAYAASMLRWGGDDARGLAGFIQGPGSVRTNGVRPATDDMVKRILALRARLGGGAAPAVQTAAPTSGAAGQAAAPATARTVPATPATSSTNRVEAPLESGASLAARVVAAARQVAGPSARIGVAGHDLVSGQRLVIGADQAFPAASVGKLAVLAEVYREADLGTRTLTGPQRSDLRSMIVASDNDAANRLIEVLGTRAINANLQALGLAGTQLVNPFGSQRPPTGAHNLTTPSDMLRLLDLLAADRLVSPRASQEMRALLLQTQDASKLKRGLPAEARLAHKTGWFTGVANDVGIVSQGDSTYTLAVFTDGITDPEIANQTIAAIARVVHQAWGPH
ncbi:MAG: serine hydrolase [Chloroflexi bacterium]|nr:serine hydrolase [Chloroflexota bacterium]